ncbi:hypothetical protein Rin_00015590 [Candidatus Regiella insecticola 5.15]|uniref:Uncharacterized protein n=1 Tax=Candidatus Regiella insecticola 5.15 TaxID=1005043 RepID=G2H0I0_9ENTR|nr:hypothetical protein Rin_00015590 [Candidatus Regiella insecticola 5.15]
MSNMVFCRGCGKKYMKGLKLAQTVAHLKELQVIKVALLRLC